MLGGRGRIQDFHLGGGGAQKIMCPRGTELTFGMGPGPAGSSRVVLMLSRAI